MMRGIAAGFTLFRRILFTFHQKPRSPDVPTHRGNIFSMPINSLHDNQGARYEPKRVGRGPASNKGKTSGRGMKGQKSRPGGGPHVRFEGGQTPLQKRLPKYGKVKEVRPREFLEYVNLEQIDYMVKLGAIDPTQPLTQKKLIEVGLVKKTRFGIKILGRGADRITYPLNIEVTDASKTAIDYVRKAGGSINLVYRTQLKLKEHLYPEKYPLPLRNPITPAWKIKKLQRLEAGRGINVEYPKPKWFIQDQTKGKQVVKSQFVFPVPIVQNSGKIRRRKPQVYRKIIYNLP